MPWPLSISHVQRHQGGDLDDDYLDDYSPVASPVVPRRAFALDHEREAEPEVVPDLPRPVKAIDEAKVASTASSSASLNPQRIAKAAIKLAPSPKVTRRNRSPSPQDKMSRYSSTSSMSSVHTQNSSSTRTMLSTPKKPAVTPGARAPPHRSISLQATSSSRNRMINGSSSSIATSSSRRTPMTMSPTSSASSSVRSSTNSLHKSGLAPPMSFNRSISADPNMNDPAILAKIGNRATKTVQRSLGKCGACAKPINEDGCTAFGKVYHKACFKCTVCRQKIQGKFFEKDGKPYCAKDFQNVQESCTVCSLPIKGDSVLSNNKAFHPECMKCFICGESLRGTYFTFQDQPICERDYKQHAEKCHGCGEAVTGKYYANGNSQVFCEECHKEQSEKCPQCHEDILGKMVKVSGRSFHPDCFVCVGCKKNMVNIPFIADDKKQVYCPDCYNNKKAPRCAHCKKPIVPKEGQKTAQRLRALDKDFHPKCFKCEDCGLLLDSKVKGRECYPFKNHVLCIKCNRKKLSSSESDTEDDEE